MSPALEAALTDPGLDAVVICPSNPYLSIDPILAVPGVRAALAGCAAPVVAVSPIVGGRAIKGPAAKRSWRSSASRSPPRPSPPVTRDLLDGFVLDKTDRALAAAIESEGTAGARAPLRITVEQTVMRTGEDRTRLAARVLGFARLLRER